MVFTGPVPPCDRLLGDVERAMRSVSLSERGAVPEASGLTLATERTYSETTVTFYRKEGA